MAPSRKMKRGKMSRRVRRGKKSTRRVRRQRGGGPFTISLKHAQPMILPLKPRPTPAQFQAKAAADKLAGNITLVGSLPEGFSGGTTVEMKRFSFTLPAGKTLISMTIQKSGGPVIPVQVGTAVGGIGVKAQVTGQNVQVLNIETASLGLVGSNTGDITLSGVISD